MSMKVLFRIQIVLASLGSLLFLVAIPMRSHSLWVVGITLMVCAMLLLLPVYLRGINRHNRRLSVATVVYALLAVAWLTVPAFHTPALVAFIVGLCLAAIGLGLGNGWRRFERRDKVPSLGHPHSDAD
jgi:hypothetical protein